MLEVSLLGVGTVLRLERDAWSMVKRLRQATNEYAPLSACLSRCGTGRCSWWGMEDCLGCLKGASVEHTCMSPTNGTSFARDSETPWIANASRPTWSSLCAAARTMAARFVSSMAYSDQTPPSKLGTIGAEPRVVVPRSNCFFYWL